MTSSGPIRGRVQLPNRCDPARWPPKRGIVRQHNTGAANADTSRGGRNRGHEYLGRGAGDGAGVVMLRDPVTMITQRVAVPRKSERLTNRSVLRSILGRG